VTVTDPAAVLADLTARVKAHAAAGEVPPASLIAVVTDLHRQLTVLARHREAHPLAYARLWVPECRTCPHPDPAAPAPPKGRRGAPMVEVRGTIHRCPVCGIEEARTSQIGAVRALLAGDYDKAFLLGGSRTGKTEAGAQVGVAVAQGADHPDTQAWARLNGLPLDRIQRSPGLFWAVSQTHTMSRTIQREKLDKYLPAGSKRRGWEADNEAEVRLPGGGKIVCKAFAQNTSEGNAKNPFEGAKIHGAWVDEEPQSVQGFDSIGARTIDYDGLVYATMTPLSGWTPFLLTNVGHLDKGTPAPPRLFVAFLHAMDNPHVSPTVVADKWAGKPEAIRRSRLRGEIVALEGAVHPDFHNGAPYVVPSFDPPTHWPRYGGIDFGARAPFCHLWAAHDESADVLHIYREHYKADEILAYHAAAIWAVEGCPACQPTDGVGSDEWTRWRVRCADGTHRCETCAGTGLTSDAPTMRWADPEGKDQRGMLSTLYDLPTAPAEKGRAASFQVLFDRMTVSPKHGTPGVVIHDRCVNLIRETARIVWRKGRHGETADRWETDGDDHAHDVLRYLVYALRGRYSAPAEEGTG
jgi:hypothetical protein